MRNLDKSLYNDGISLKRVEGQTYIVLGTFGNTLIKTNISKESRRGRDHGSR